MNRKAVILPARKGLVFPAEPACPWAARLLLPRLLRQGSVLTGVFIFPWGKAGNSSVVQ